jgi:hypothetical protein
VTTYGQDLARGFQVFSTTLRGVRRLGVHHLNPQTQERVFK